MIYSQALVIRRAPSAKQGTFSGLASTWNVDRHGTRIARGAFAKSIAALKSGERRVALLFEHNPLEQLGAVTNGAETDDGLQIDAAFVLGTPAADRAYQLALADAVGLSVGFGIEEKNIRVDADGVLTYVEVDWMETSIVSVPSNRESVLHKVRSLDGIAPAEFERMLREGAVPPMPRRLAAKIAKAALPLIVEQDNEPEHDPVELAALAAALDGLSHSFKR